MRKIMQHRFLALLAMLMISLVSLASQPQGRKHHDGFDPKRFQAELQEAVALLPDVQRTVFTLKYYDNMKYSEMSKVLSTSEGALKASYHLAVKKITDFFNRKD